MNGLLENLLMEEWQHQSLPRSRERTKPMKVVYIAGPYRSKNGIYSVVQNIRVAEELALQVWNAGAACICPHKNTALFDGAAPDSVWLEGGLEIMARCDAVLVAEGWQGSSGTCQEIIEAHIKRIPVFWDMAGLRQWLASEG